MGGLTVARMSGEGGGRIDAQLEAQVACVRPLREEVAALLAVPEQSLSTEDARRVLPEQYSRADVPLRMCRIPLLTARGLHARTPRTFVRCPRKTASTSPIIAALCLLLPARRN